MYLVFNCVDGVLICWIRLWYWVVFMFFWCLMMFSWVNLWVLVGLLLVLSWVVREVRV